MKFVCYHCGGSGDENAQGEPMGACRVCRGSGTSLSAVADRREDPLPADVVEANRRTRKELDRARDRAAAWRDEYEGVL